MQTLRRIPYWSVLALLVYMPLHIFLSQSLSLVTGGLDAWKIGKDVLVAGLSVFIICLVWHQRRAVREFKWLVALATAYMVLHLVLWATHPAIVTDSALLGIIYNNRLFGFMLLGTGAGLLLTAKQQSLTVLTKVVLGISTLVALLGILQYFLPKDILTHLGYSADRGALPAFFIDDRPNFPRIMSTLRDPNSLGAYLIVPITWLTALLVRAQLTSKRLLLGGLLLLHGLALFLTFSRGAWAATAVSVAVLMIWQYAGVLRVLIRRFWPLLIALFLIMAVGVFTARDTYVFKSFVTHRTGAPKAAYDSNGFHWVFAKRGLEGIVRNPFGHGPGTAGLASIKNPAGSFLTENYYIQIGYEVGVVGLLIFLTTHVVIYRALWLRRDMVLAGVLLASFWGYVFINLLFHMWSNEAVVAQWWLLAGLVIGTVALKRKAKNKA